MTFQTRREQRPNKFGVDDHVCVLDDGQGSFVEIAPALGFNAYRWHVPDGELLYTDPKYFEENKPTRSGVPILFPFPNRIRDGRFTWAGNTYQLPTNDPTAKNAIHGFVCRRPWRVTSQGADAGAAWVTAEFVGSKDAPDALDFWPTDFRLSVTYRLERQSLDVLAVVSNPGAQNLPWGLGYHPYFNLSLFAGAAAEVTVPAHQYWELVDSLPTGQCVAVDARRDLRAVQTYDKLHLDDVFTDLDRSTDLNAMVCTGMVSHGDRRLELYTSGVFRAIVAFTPPHRQAICLEPYTCATDAINLQQKGIDAGWRVLKPGAGTQARVRLVYKSV